MNIASWASWSEKGKPGSALKGPLGLVVIHHSYRPDVPPDASVEAEEAALRSMDRFHREERKWSGLGYSFCIFQSGRVYEGRGWLRAGAHTEGQNRTAHGICFVFDGSAHAPTPAALKACRDLLADGVRNGSVRPDYEVQPHDRYQKKVCPGARIKAILTQLRPEAAVPRNMKKGDKGADVVALQEKLRVNPTSGYFGPLTHEAVKQFQRKNRDRLLAAGAKEPVDDGIVGPATRAVLGL